MLKVGVEDLCEVSGGVRALVAGQLTNLHVAAESVGQHRGGARRSQRRRQRQFGHGHAGLVVVALEAEISVVGLRGPRTLPAGEFVTGPYLTALDHAELIDAIVVPKRPKTERWGHYKATRKIGEYAESMAIALVDKESNRARLVLGAVDGPPLVLEESAIEITKGAKADKLSLVIQHELAASDRGFSPSKLHLHRTVSLRAIQNAGLL